MKNSQDSPKGLAVALRYNGHNAPKVVAKGSGHIAEEIVHRAQAANVPINQDHELVQLLSKVKLNREIPESLYLACAQVLAFAYHLKKKKIPEANRNQTPDR